MMGNKKRVRLFDNSNNLKMLLLPTNSLVNSFALIDSNKYCKHNAIIIKVGNIFFIASWI